MGKSKEEADALINLPEDDYQRIREIGEFSYPVQLIYFELADLFMSRLRWNWHTEMEFFYVKKGSAVFLSDDYRLELSEGQGIFINQGVMHALMFDNNDTGSCGLYSFKFHPAFLFGYGNLTLNSKYLSPVISSHLIRVIPVKGDTDWEKEMLSIMRQIIDLNLNQEFGYELLTKRELLSMWMLLLKASPQAHVENKPPIALSLDEARVKETILYIEANYGNNLSLDEIAGAVHISKSECCRCFKRVLGFTPFEYLTKYRIFKAANILRNDPLSISSISELAFQVGFNSASYFNKVFRENMGCTPSEFKKHLKDIPLEI